MGILLRITNVTKGKKNALDSNLQPSLFLYFLLGSSVIIHCYFKRKTIER